MNGYFISAEQANELGFLVNPNVVAKLQKTIIVITQNDVKEHKKNIQLNEGKIQEMAIWFYKNYFDSLINTLTSFNN